MTVEEALGIADIILGEKRLTDRQQLVFRECWEGKTYQEIAELTNYSPVYIRSIGFQIWRLLSQALGERVTLNNVRAVLRRYMQETLVNAADRDANSFLNNDRTADIDRGRKLLSNYRQDWGEAPDVSVFYDRHQELERLAQWIVRDRCRLVTVLGMGGIGKTTLAIKLAEQIQGEFDYLIWRSLRQAPTPDALLTEIVQFISGHEVMNLPTTIEGKISYLIEQLRNCRCLLILDNLESILQSGDRLGHYRDGYQDYGQILRRVGETAHQSCLLLTSREIPTGLAAREGENLPIRSMKLSGFKVDTAKIFFAAKGDFFGLETEWQTVVEHYAGNPLALKMIAPLIKDFASGSISELAELIERNRFIFHDIYDILERQFERLSELEMEVMYWLAINREPVKLTELQADFLQSELQPELLKALISLQRRSLIERDSSGFSQQPVIMEYAIQKLVANFERAIVNEELEILTKNALVKAQSKDYIREAQTRFILDPLIEKLWNGFKSKAAIEKKLGDILTKLRRYSLSTGYAAGNIINLLERLKIDLSDCDFSDLNIWQAYLANSKLHRVNFSRSDLSKSVFAETLNGIWSVAFSPDGQLLATADINCEIRLWQIPDGKQLLTCKGHTSWVTGVVFSPDGQTLATSSGDRTLKLWDVKTGRCLRTFSGHAAWTSSIAFSPDGRTIASASVDGTVKLWDVRTANCLQTLKGHDRWVRTVAFSPFAQRSRREFPPAPPLLRGVGGIVASGSDDNAIKLWDAATGECLQTLTGHADRVRSVAFSSNGQILASGSDDRTVKLWDVDTGQCRQTLKGHLSQVRCVTFSPTIDSRETTQERGILASGGEDGTIVAWDSLTGQRLRVLQGHSSTVWSVAFSPDGPILASGSLDRQVKLWDTRTGQCLKTLQGQSTALWSAAISTDGRTIVAGSTDCTVKVWDAIAGKYQQSLAGHTNWCWSVALSPIPANPERPELGEIAVSGSFDGTVRLWNLAAGENLKILQGHHSYVMAVAFSPDGQIVASGSADQTIVLWDVNSGQCLKTLPGEGGNVWAIAFSPLDTQNSQTDSSASRKGRKNAPAGVRLTGSPSPKQEGFLASSHDNCTVKLWDVNTGLCLRTFPGHTSRVRAVAFSPDGKTIASGSEDYTLKLWDVNTGQCLQSWQAASDEILSIAFSPDGKTLASSGNESVIKLWDIDRGECLQVLQGHTNWVFALTYSADGRLISASQDGSVRLWDVQTGKCLKILYSPRPYEGMKITGATGLTPAQRATLVELGAVD
ncbi:MAG: pentapeptide repeat-containing protein [Cyanosarcina radialis HA8281-LM2]|jgi:WD40 repeat protein|nr:pentapeptide repeat-containing protein [Cyanosarcina radialis HA8281-LM2]